jgi:hypothetical protein
VVGIRSRAKEEQRTATLKSPCRSCSFGDRCRYAHVASWGLARSPGTTSSGGRGRQVPAAAPTKRKMKKAELGDVVRFSSTVPGEDLPIPSAGGHHFKDHRYTWTTIMAVGS